MPANIAFLLVFAVTGVQLPLQAQGTDSLILGADEYNTRYRKTALVTGYHLQFNSRKGSGDLQFLELGLARMIEQNGRHGPVTMGVYVSEEIYPGKQSIFGTKAGVFLHYMFDLGFSAVYYTDFRNGNFRLRPEFGIGFMGMRAVAGFNIPTIRNKDFYRLQKNYGQISLQLFIKLHQKEIPAKGPVWNDLFKKQKNGHRKDHLG